MKKLFILIHSMLLWTCLNAAIASESCPSNNFDSIDCLKEQEADLLKAHPTLFKRDGNKITFYSLDQQGSSSFSDFSSKLYVLEKHIPELRLSFIVEISENDTFGYLYHHDQGHRYRAHGNIKVSSNFESIIAFNSNVKFDGSGNSFLLFKTDTGKERPNIAVQFNPTDFGVVDAQFINNGEIELHTLYEKSKDKTERTCILKKFGTLWQLVDPTCYLPKT